MGEVTMPRLSDTMSEGAIGKWLKQPGDHVESGDIIAEIETDKATMELQAFESGTLQKILVPEGQMTPIGTPIALIGEGAVAPPDADASLHTRQVGAQAQAPTTQAATTAAIEQNGGARQAEAPPQPAARAGDGQALGDRVKVSPVARRLAEQFAVDLSQVQGTGPGGRIIKENVEEFYQQTQRAPAPSPAPTPAPPPAPTPALAGQAAPLSRMRRVIARAMTESKPGTPHIYVSIEVDMGAAMRLRKEINDSGAAEVKISVNDLVVKAAAQALRKFPQINSSYALVENGQPGVVRHDQINVSVAVALEDGLIAPVVAAADKKSIGAIAAEIKDMAARAREGKIRQNELEGATFQVSNLGMYDVLEFVSVITPPQAASLAVGAVRKTPVVRDDAIVAGELMRVTLSADHRVTDGATAAQYLQELRRRLESPMSLLV